MRIQISFNSDSLDYIISDDGKSQEDMPSIKTKKGNGKTIITLNTPSNKDYIYLTIFIKNKSIGKDRRLNNYCFKYNNGESEQSFTEYNIIGDREVKFDIKPSSNSNLTEITAKFNRINATDVDIIYCLKVVPNKTHAYQESFDTIAVSESPSAYALVRDPRYFDDIVTLNIKVDDPQWVYLEVTATIIDREDIEYESYMGKYEPRPYIGPGGISGGVSTALFIVVGSIMLLMVIGLVIAVIIFKNKNKSLLNQVKHVSFQAKSNSTDQDLLLNKKQSQENSQVSS